MVPVDRFLLVFDHAAGRLLREPQRFRGEAGMLPALSAYDDAEDEFAHARDRIEVLLVGAASIQDVKVTHRRFFHRPGAAPTG